MVEWWAWVFVVIGINIIAIGRFLAWSSFKRGEYGWYRSGWDGANAKAHCFLFTGERVPRISFKRYFSFCRRKYMSYSGNWERIEDPSPDIMCTTCMDMVRRKTTTRFHLLPWKKSGGSEMRITDEQKLGMALLIIGVFVTVVTHVEMDKYPNSRTFRWDLRGYKYDKNPPPELLIRECPISIIRAQEAGLMVSSAGVALLIRPFIFKRERATEGVR